MSQKTQTKPQNVKSVSEVKQPDTVKKPNEKYGFYFSSSLKITDPDTGKVLVQMRCD